VLRGKPRMLELLKFGETFNMAIPSQACPGYFFGRKV
jgi:hypothetical protein